MTEKPRRASHHCRHYGWSLDDGPSCRIGALASGEPVIKCLPLKPERVIAEPCAQRQEWTETERQTARDEQAARSQRLMSAILALPPGIPSNGHGSVSCQSCGGTLRYGRARRHFQIACTTPGCCSAFMTLANDRPWP